MKKSILTSLLLATAVLSLAIAPVYATEVTTSETTVSTNQPFMAEVTGQGDYEYLVPRFRGILEKETSNQTSIYYHIKNLDSDTYVSSRRHLVNKPKNTEDFSDGEIPISDLPNGRYSVEFYGDSSDYYGQLLTTVSFDINRSNASSETSNPAVKPEATPAKPEVKPEVKPQVKQTSQAPVKKEAQKVVVSNTPKSTMKELPKTGDASSLLSFVGILSTAGAFLVKRNKKPNL